MDTGTNASADNNGIYVSLNGVYYQLQISRELNQYSPEDHGYLAGVGNHPPGAKQVWYGVFLRAINESHQARRTADHFDIRDTQGNVYDPVAVDPNSNQFVWTAQTLQPLQTEPLPDTTASFGPTQGALVLFKLNTSVYANRPLTLEHPLRVPDGNHLAEPLRRLRLLRAAGVAVFIVALAAALIAGPAGAAAWSPALRLAGPAELDVTPLQVAFGPGGQAAVGFGFVDPDRPGGATASVALIPAAGKPARARRVPHARQVLDLAYLGGRLQILSGTSGGGLPCCTQIQTLAMGTRGFSAPHSLIRGLAGVSTGPAARLRDRIPRRLRLLGGCLGVAGGA